MHNSNSSSGRWFLLGSTKKVDKKSMSKINKNKNAKEWIIDNRKKTRENRKNIKKLKEFNNRTNNM